VTSSATAVNGLARAGGTSDRSRNSRWLSGRSLGAELNSHRHVKALRHATAHADEPRGLEYWVFHVNTCQMQELIPENRVCSTVLVLVIAECPRGPQPRIKLGGSIPRLRRIARDIQDRGLDPRLVTYGSRFPG
jgi:hypothetical protein